MRRMLFTLMVGLGLLGQVAHAHTVTNAPEGAWRYSYKGQLSGSTTWYASNTNELAGLTSGGYVTYETPGWFHGSSGLQLRTYETWVVAEADVTLSCGSGGDDGHSVFIDGVFIVGGGYGVNVYFDLVLQAGVPRRLLLASNNALGSWHVNCKGRIGDVGDNAPLEDLPWIRIHADGEFDGATTAFLVADSGSLTDTEREFLALVAVGGSVDVLDAAAVKSGVDLSPYNAFCAFGYGPSSITSVFDQAFCDLILGAVEEGATLVVNRMAEGACLLIAGGYSGGGTIGNWTPAYTDTRFVTAVVPDEPLMAGVVPYTGDPHAQTIWYWHSVESESMLWRVENQRTYSGFYQRGPHVQDPDGHLTEGFTASTLVYGGARTPFWYRGKGRVIELSTIHWTFDQSTGDGGTIGLAGQQILANISALPHFGDSRGPVAYYPFNGDAQDESGYGNHGTVNGAVLTEDRHGEAGKAYWFDGVDDHIRLPSIIERYDVATLVAWVKTAGEVAYGQGVVSKPRRPNGSGLRINANASSVGLSFSRELSGPDLHAGVTVRGVESNEWHMLVGVVNEDELTLYLDGEAVSNDTFAAGAATSTEDMVIGRELHQDANEYGKRYFQGAIDEVRVYDRALSANEVAELYAAEVPDPADYDGEVSDVVAVGWDQRVGLRWVAPSDSAGVRVQMTTGGAPSGPNDGVTVFDGSRSTTVVTGLVDDVVYDFGLFAYDASGTFGTGVFVQAMPFNKTRPMLEWEPVDGATWYGVRMRGRGGRNLDQWLEQSVPRWRVDRDLLPGRHMVQVRGYVPVSGPTRWARPRHIEVSGRIPVEPPMVYAPRGEVDASRPVFLWDWVEDAVWYEIQMHLGHRTWAVVWVQDVLSLVPATDSPISQGKWRIRACGLDGRGRWSEWVRFAFSGGEASTPVSGEIDDSYLHIETSRGEDLGLGPRLSTVTPDGQSGEVLVTWASEPGATYTIYGSTNLVDGEWFAVETMVGDGTELEFLHDGGAERIMFYRLGVE